jgi:hypothetical protein
MRVTLVIGVVATLIGGAVIAKPSDSAAVRATRSALVDQIKKKNGRVTEISIERTYSANYPPGSVGVGGKVTVVGSPTNEPGQVTPQAVGTGTYFFRCGLLPKGKKMGLLSLTVGRRFIACTTDGKPVALYPK